MAPARPRVGICGRSGGDRSEARTPRGPGQFDAAAIRVLAAQDLKRTEKGVGTPGVISQGQNDSRSPDPLLIRGAARPRRCALDIDAHPADNLPETQDTHGFPLALFDSPMQPVAEP